MMPEIIHNDALPFEVAQNPEPVASTPEPIDHSAKSIEQMLKDLAKIEREINRHTKTMESAAERIRDAELSHAALRARLAEVLAI